MKLKPRLAAVSMGGRWTPNEDRPMHATTDGQKSLCGVSNIAVFKDPEPVLFATVTHKCRRCVRVLSANSPEAIVAAMNRALARKKK